MSINHALWAAGASLTNVQQRRPIQGFSALQLFESRSKSWHDSLQISADIKSGNSFLSRFTYVYGKTFATTDEDLGLGSNNAANPWNLDLDKAEIAPRQVLRYSYVYDLPIFRGNQHIAARLLGGWQASGSLFVSSGGPVNVILGQDWNFDGVGNDRPDAAGAVSHISGSKDDRARRFFDTTAFANPSTRNTFGTAQRNAVWGPGQWNTDFSLLKSFNVTETVPVQFRAEVFNLLNHNNLTNPNGTLSSVDFGRILNRVGNRTMQMGLRVTF